MYNQNKTYCLYCPFGDKDKKYCILTKQYLPFNNRTKCTLNYNILSNKQILNILHYTQKWRKGANIKPIPPYILSMAIDKTINNIRSINKSTNK